MSEALATTLIMLPRTRVLYDVVLLDIPGRDYSNQESLLRETLEDGSRTSGDKQEFIDGFNWVEVAYLFAPTAFPDDSSTDEEAADLINEADEALCRQVRDAWDAWLNWKYKDRSFEVFLLSPEETGSTIGVGFREITQDK